MLEKSHEIDEKFMGKISPCGRKDGREDDYLSERHFSVVDSFNKFCTSDILCTGIK